MWVVGHSLGGLVGVAAQGRYSLADGLVVLGAGLWGFERSCVRRRVRQGLMWASIALCKALGKLPARTLGLGTDEALPYWEQSARWAIEGKWTALDGFDYRAAASRIAVPVAGFRGTEDRLIRLEDHRNLLCMSGARVQPVVGAGHFGVVRGAIPQVVGEVATWAF
jgi:pimeloyl-ACP methyl ester carboxylesterase